MKRKAFPGVGDYFHGAVTVGARGQVVIPASVRKALGIEPGDKLLVLTHPAGIGVLLMPIEHAGRVVNVLKQLIEAEEGGK